ncbi:MAG: mini-ribonuclease [Clostridiales bacterium]|jgi:ribonuclease-3 family protein|nr:mini-ribonuclease [Clostridiales bacterium]MDN5299254.1 mini-ribonuclease [Clostridiales bacterium]
MASKGIESMSDFLNKLNMVSMSKTDARMMNPLKLAFLGDAIYEAYIRYYIISKHVLTTSEMSKMAVKYVNAEAQAYIVTVLKDEFTEDEWNMLKRGRNQKTGSRPKHASVSDYRYATGFESLLGYLYVLDEKDRIYEIVGMAIDAIDRKETL